MKLEPSRRLCHLPLVVDVLRRTHVLDVIDHACGQHKLSEVSTGECVAVLLSGVFVGAHSLWRIRERLEPYDMNTVMQDPYFDLAKFPEERLAKALDDLYVVGLDKIMTSIALQAIQAFDIQTDFLHFDTTSLSFYGAYEREDPWADVDGISPPPKVTYGYSKAKRPDLKQVLFGCLSSADGGIPLMGKVMDGNMSDSVAAAEFFSRVRELVQSPKDVCLVADSKGWCTETLSLVQTHDLRLLSRLPRTTRLHREIMAETWKPEAIHDRPSLKKGAQVEKYEIMGFDKEQQITVEVTQPDGSVHTEQRTIPVRVVRIFSTALLRQKMGSLERLRTREKQKSITIIRDWSTIMYACESDAQRAAQRHTSQYQAITHNIIATVVRHNEPPPKGRGRPRKNPEPSIHTGIHWRITYLTQPVDDATSQTRLHDAASFILVRTRTKGWEMTDAEMIDQYRGQYRLEHGFSWLKSGADINPMFIQTPHRIAAMGSIYCIGLMIWNIIQRTVRAYLRTTQQGLPYHRGKLSDNITTRFLFELFPMVQTITMTLPNGRVEKHLLGLEQYQKLATKALQSSENIFKPVIKKG